MQGYFSVTIFGFGKRQEMDSLLPEHLLAIASRLDGDDYLALSQTTRKYQTGLNEKLFLADVTQLNNFPFLVVDAQYYVYCYSQHFLTRRQLRDNSDFYTVLKRTIRAGKVTNKTREHVKVHVNQLMQLHLEGKHYDAESQLEKIQKRIAPVDSAITREIDSFLKLHFCRLSKIQHCLGLQKNLEYMQRARAGDVD